MRRKDNYVMMRRATPKREVWTRYKYNCKSFTAGISNVTIEEFIEEEDDNFKNNFVGVFSSNRTTTFLNFMKMVKRKGGYCPFVILNIDRSNLGIHWWSILNIHPKKQLFLFNSYGFTGFKT